MGVRCVTSFDVYEAFWDFPGLHAFERESYQQRAALVDTIALSDGDRGPGERIALLVRHAGSVWPFLIVELDWEDRGYRAIAALLFVPETGILFVAVQEHILAYMLEQPKRLWLRNGWEFWSWKRYGDRVLMAAELDFWCFDLQANEVWTAYVEPPWEYRIEDDMVHLNVMEVRATFPVATGPADPQALAQEIMRGYRDTSNQQQTP